jgi:hypothetical protein
VPERPAFRWAQDPKVRREVEACRRRALSEAIGRLTRMSVNAVDGIVTLAKEADSESVQPRAWRAVFADQIAVSKFSDLEYRMAEIEEQLSERTGHTLGGSHGSACFQEGGHPNGLCSTRRISGRWPSRG